jgi:flagellar basal body-associated protein FliL
MTDMNDRLRERWNDRRKKGTNWTKLIIMVLILVAILVAMNWLGREAQEQENPKAETTDSVTVTAPVDTTVTQPAVPGVGAPK